MTPPVNWFGCIGLTKCITTKQMYNYFGINISYSYSLLVYVYIRHVSFFSLSNTLAEYYSRCKNEISPQIDVFNGVFGVNDRLIQLKIDISRVLITDARISTRIFAVGENDRQ